MKVIMVEPLKSAYVAEIGTDLESMQKAVGGTLRRFIHIPIHWSLSVMKKENMTVRKKIEL